MDTNTKNLATWLTAELCKTRPEGQGVCKFILRTSAPGSKGAEVDDFKVESRIEIDEIPMFAQNILARAQEDADGHGPMVQSYTVFTYLRRESKPQGRYPFRLRGEQDMDLDDEAGYEAPNNKGLMSQLMRHNEALTRGIATSAASMLAIATRRAESQDRLVEKLLEERMRTFEVLEAAKSEQHSRDMELMMMDAGQKRKDEAFGKLMQLVPVVINRLAGGKVLPQKTDPLMMMLEPLIDSLSQEQLHNIGSSLKPEQMITFAEILRTFQQKKLASKSEN